jgi:adenylate kinase family enzyme
VRINVIGTSGSGKTTFGKQLAELLNITFLEMDAIFWGPEWYFPPDEEFLPLVSKMLEAENWVLDGNYTRTLPIKWERVDVVIWLNYSFPRTIYQAVRRAVTRLFSQEEFWPGTGNRENLKMLFSRDSIVWWTIRSYTRHVKRNAAYLDAEEYSQITFHRIRSPRQAVRFLQKVQGNPDYLLEKS